MRNWLLILILSFQAASLASAGGPQAKLPRRKPARATSASMPDGTWVATWTASPAMAAPDAPTFTDQTLREIVHLTAGGTKVRVRFSNQFGAQSLSITDAHVAVRSSGSSIALGSDRKLTFHGSGSIVIPPNAPALSDPVELSVKPQSDFAISIYLAGPTQASSIHWAAQQTSYISRGDQTASATMPAPSPTTSWSFLAGVEVAGGRATEAVVAFGDSITDGAASTGDANRRWPDVLAARLLAKNPDHPVAVLNAGIGGNRILHDGSGGPGPKFGPNALSRFDRDALAQPGVKYVIVLEGINDIGHPGAAAPASEEVSADQIIGGLQQLVERAHEKGVRVFGATITPFEGTKFPGYYKPERELKRQAVNQWIRSAGAFDGVVDFERAVRDPQHPSQLLPQNDSGDHLHPSDAGYRAMAEAIDLTLFSSP